MIGGLKAWLLSSNLLLKIIEQVRNKETSIKEKNDWSISYSSSLYNNDLL